MAMAAGEMRRGVGQLPLIGPAPFRAPALEQHQDHGRSDAFQAHGAQLCLYRIAMEPVDGVHQNARQIGPWAHPKHFLSLTA